MLLKLIICSSNGVFVQALNKQIATNKHLKQLQQTQKNNAAVKVQAATKRFLEHKKFNLKKKSALTIQTITKRYLAHKEFQQMQTDIINIQATIRGYIERSKTQKKQLQISEYLAHTVPYQGQLKVGDKVPNKWLQDYVIKKIIDNKGLLCFMLAPCNYKKDETYDIKIIFRGTKSLQSFIRDIEPLSPRETTFKLNEKL